MDEFFDDPIPLTSSGAPCHNETLMLIAEGMSYLSAHEAIAHHFQQKLIDFHQLRQRTSRQVDLLREAQEEELASVLEMGSKGEGKVLVSSRLMEPVFARHNKEVEEAVATSTATIAQEKKRCNEELIFFLKMICSDLRSRDVAPLPACPPATQSWYDDADLHCLRVPNPRRDKLHGARTRDPSVAPIILQMTGSLAPIEKMQVYSLPLDAVVGHLLRLSHHRLGMHVVLDEATGHSDDVWAAQDDEIILATEDTHSTVELGGVIVRVGITTCLSSGNIIVSVPSCPTKPKVLDTFIAALLNFSVVCGVEHLAVAVGPDPSFVLRSFVECVSLLLVDSTAQRAMNPWSTCLPVVLAGTSEGAVSSPLAKGKTSFNLGFSITLLVAGGPDADRIQAAAQAAFPDGFELF